MIIRSCLRPLSLLLLGGLVACLSVVLTPSAAQACTCRNQPLPQQLKRADVVAVGTVTDVAKANNGDVFTVSVAHAFAGDVSTPLLVRTGADSCAVTMEPGGRYLVVGAEQGSTVTTNQCSGTQPVSNDTLRIVQRVLGPGDSVDPPAPQEPSEPEYTRVADPITDSITTAAMPALIVAALAALLWLLLGFLGRRPRTDVA